MYFLNVAAPRSAEPAGGASCANAADAINNAISEIRKRIATAPQRPWETISTRAGSPRLTTARARDSAGPMALGSLIGPSPWSPSDCANLAKSLGLHGEG